MEPSSRNGLSVVPELQKQRVLLVDDDEPNRAHCASALRSAGLEVIEAGGVREAHATAVREQPHLIVIHLEPQSAALDSDVSTMFAGGELILAHPRSSS